jgi:hypothetical protein
MAHASTVRDHASSPAPAGGFRFHVVPHTHWDREWYLPLEAFRLELADRVEEILTTLERDRRFRSFTLDGQAVVLEDYLELRPEQEARLRTLLASGRLMVGPSYVLPDEFLVGGESLVRNLLLGRAVCERLAVQPSGVGYLPDSFGHPAQLPQILRGFGIDTFLFSRGLGDEVERVGRVFRWRAPEGSEVTAVNLLGHYDSAAGLRSREDLAGRAERLVERYRADLDRVGLRDVLLCNGSDHLPIQPELPDWLPAGFRICSFDEYVALIGDRLPSFAGELLGSREQNILRGVNSARIYLKQANEQAERELLSAEVVASLAALAGRAAYPAEDFRFAWRELLRNHPHDSICGCSADEVHEDMLERYRRLGRTVSVLATKAVASLAGYELALLELRRPPAGTLVNPLPWRRRRLVGGEVVELDGFAAARLEPALLPRQQPRRGRSIRAGRFRVASRRTGLTIADLATGVECRGAHIFEDEPDRGDLYTFCPVEGTRRWRSPPPDARVLREGVVSELELVWPRIRTVVRVVEGIDRIEFETDVVNRSRDHRLRVRFPAQGEGVRAEGQFAVVERSLVPAPPLVEWVEPPDPTQHTLGAVALGDLVLLTRGLPEYEATEDGLALTLLRCVGTISRAGGELETRPRAAGPPIPTPGGQCLGRHRFQYALRLDARSLDEVALLRAAHDYRYDFVSGPRGAPPPPPLALGGDPVAFSCLKGAEDGDSVILRLFNPGRRAARVRLNRPASRLRLDERGDETPLTGQARLRPGEIVTLRVRRVT